MDRGILFVAVIALAWGGLANACRRSADATHLQTVDSLITTMDAAIRTLNELDQQRFQQAADAYREREPLFRDRFLDTLDRNSAELLGDQFLSLSAATEMGRDHQRTLEELHGAAGRLRALRLDVMNVAMDMEEEQLAINTEEQVCELLQANVQLVIGNYRTMQQTWDLLPRTDSLLTAGQQGNIATLPR